MVSTKQDVLAVIERSAIDSDRTGATAKNAACLKKCGCHTRCRQFDGSGDARPAAANDGNPHPRTQVLQAIQILRTGVSAMR